MYVNIKEGDMGRGNGLGKSDRIATIEALKKKETGIMNMGSQQHIFWIQEVLLQGSHEDISIRGGHLGPQDYTLNLKIMEQVKGEVLMSEDEVEKG